MPLTKTLRFSLFGAVATTVSLIAISCEDDDASALSLLGDGCLLNSECNEGLVCVFRRCHIQCVTSGDCPIGADGNRLRCVVGEKPASICQLEDERACQYHSECPGEQICGPDGECRDQCKDDRDCVSGQTCAGGVCAEAEELNEEGELEGEPPPEGQETGFPCVYDSQCVGLAPEGGPEFVCKDGGCNFGCFTNIDCEPNFTCEPDDGDATTPGKCTYQGGGVDSFCVPNEQRKCDCWPPDSTFDDGIQLCAADGSGYEDCMGVGGGGPFNCAPP
jgi:hypothetical protein